MGGQPGAAGSGGSDVRIAVVGTGIAGLSAAWALRRSGHEVVVLERKPRLGMDAHAVSPDPSDSALAVDVPLRAFTPDLWRNLVSLCSQVGVQTREIDLAASLSELGGDTYLRYENVALGRYLLPLRLRPRHLTPHALELVYGIARLKLGSARELERGTLGGLTLREYLEAGGYSRRFAEDLLFPMLGTVCTCSNESLARYPAALVLQAVQGILGARPLRRFIGGTREVVRRLAADVPSRCGVELHAVRATPTGARVRHADGAEEHFDHVVVATQANHALLLLGEEAREEKEVLGEFRYESAAVSVHTDARLMPRRREDWSPINFFVPKDRSASMSTVWVNRIEPSLAGRADVFQTWNPLVDPDPALELSRVVLQRPVVDERSVRAVERLAQLHRQPGRRVWLCGSYAAPGVPLLESAVLSSLRVAAALGTPVPWAQAA